MKLQLATAGDVAVPPQIGRGRSSFGPSVADASAPMKIKMKKIATADIDGTVALAALGRLEIATKELRAVKRTASGEPDLKGLLSKATAMIASREAANSEELEGEPEEARKRVLNQIWRDQESLGEEIGSMEEIEHDLHFYRGHLARKHAESEFDAEEMANLADGENEDSLFVPSRELEALVWQIRDFLSRVYGHHQLGDGRPK